MQACKPDSVSHRRWVLIIYLVRMSPRGSIDLPILLFPGGKLDEQPFFCQSKKAEPIWSFNP